MTNTWIKAGFWMQMCKPCKGYNGWFNLDQHITTIINTEVPPLLHPADRITSGEFSAIIDSTGTTTFDGSIVPSNPNSSLGTPEIPWKDVYVSPGSIYISDINPLNLPVTLTNSNQYLRVSQGGLKITSNDGLYETLQLDNNGVFILKSTQAVDSNIPSMQIIGNISGEIIPGSNPSMLAIAGPRDFTTRIAVDGIGYDPILSVNAHAAFIGRQARGVTAFPISSLENDIISVFGGNPYSDNYGFSPLASTSIKFVCSQNQTNTKRGTKVEVWSTPKDSIDDQKILTFDQYGITFEDDTTQSTAAVAQIQSDWEQLNTLELDYIKNKPFVPDLTGYGVPISYTPIWADGTFFSYTENPTTGSYIKSNKLIEFNISVDCATVTNFGTGQYTLTLPFNASGVFTFMGTVWDNSMGKWYGIKGLSSLNSNVITLWDGNTAEFTTMRNNNPVNLATADKFYINGTYQSV